MLTVRKASHLCHRGVEHGLEAAARTTTGAFTGTQCHTACNSTHDELEQYFKKNEAI